MVFDDDIEFEDDKQLRNVPKPETIKNPWDNGDYDYFDFRKELNEIVYDGKGHDVGKERIEW